MKTKYIILSALLLSALSVSAQLEVKTSGNVKVSNKMSLGIEPDDHTCFYLKSTGPGDSSPYYGVRPHIAIPSYILHPCYAIHATASAMNVTYMQGPQPIIGVYGTAVKHTTIATLAAGVAGMANSSGGVGVLGCIGSIPTGAFSATDKYAGYFNGTTKVNGTLLTNLIVLNGDTLSLNNVRRLSDNAASNLSQLTPVSYSFKTDSTWKYDENMQREMEGTHYGFIAQDVQKVLPELVYERDGNLSVNYVEMIPLLLMEIQRLSAEVEDLKKLNK